ncbi:MAG TPA: hypothetical protein VGN63_22985 [Flavisolibacter sp.]|jgi:hypothetical protein|nr:hypothetical protein [Flavisolibacter sp.]
MKPLLIIFFIFFSIPTFAQNDPCYCEVKYRYHQRWLSSTSQSHNKNGTLLLGTYIIPVGQCTSSAIQNLISNGFIKSPNVPALQERWHWIEQTYIADVIGRPITQNYLNQHNQEIKKLIAENQNKYEERYLAKIDSLYIKLSELNLTPQIEKRIREIVKEALVKPN